VNCGGGGGGGGGGRQTEPAGTLVPSGHITGGGGGGGQGCVAGTCVPSAQVCKAGALGVVAQADNNADAKMTTDVRFMALSSCSCGRTSRPAAPAA
jgi:hypothetical protein